MSYGMGTPVCSVMWLEAVMICPQFIKEKGDMEKEYAKNVRKLVSKYTHMMEGKETTQAKGVRWLFNF